MADIAPLKAAYETEIATISDTLRKARATYQLDVYCDAMAKQAALEANDITSYSIAGRTITRRDIKAGQQATQQLAYDLESAIYGTSSLIDNNTYGWGSNTQ